MSFEHDPDPFRASTPPPRLYTDPGVLSQERERVFGRTWQLAADHSQVAASGQFVCVDVAGEPIVIVRDGGELRGFYNVCRHRSGPVAIGSGQRQTLQCAYHGWTYLLDGRLRRAPEMEGAIDFDPAAVALVPVRVDTWGPLVFVHLDPAAPPLASALGEVPARAAGLEAMVHVARRDYEVACNWKVYVNNYLEGYHIPIVHPALARELDYAQYRVETGDGWSLQHAPVQAPTAGRHYDADRGGDARYFWVFPNLMLNAYQGQLQTNVVFPVSVDRTVIRFDWFAPACRDLAEWSSLVSFSEAIQDEDRAICERVQRNLGSRAAAPGRYCGRRENGLHQFHGMLARHLSVS